MNDYNRAAYFNDLLQLSNFIARKKSNKVLYFPCHPFLWFYKTLLLYYYEMNDTALP